MASPNWPALLEHSVSNAGYFSTADAATLGFSPELLIHHVDAGRLIRVRRGIYRVKHLPPSDDEDLVVIWLWSKRQGVFSHRTALALHELSDALPAGVDLTLHRSCAGRRLRVPEGVRLHYKDVSPQETVWIDHVPVTSVLRTLQDCAALPIAPDLLHQAVWEAEKRGLASPSAIASVRAEGGA